MKVLKITLVSILPISIGLLFSFAFAAGDAAKGKVLFNDAQLGGGTAGISCNSCHPHGKGLEKAADKKDLPKVINSCIRMALKGNGIDPKSAEMADLIAYIKSLKGK
jgi:mono/diheme cytochrome c family protein